MCAGEAGLQALSVAQSLCRLGHRHMDKLVPAGCQPEGWLAGLYKVAAPPASLDVWLALEVAGDVLCALLLGPAGALVTAAHTLVVHLHQDAAKSTTRGGTGLGPLIRLPRVIMQLTLLP